MITIFAIFYELDIMKVEIILHVSFIDGGRSQIQIVGVLMMWVRVLDFKTFQNCWVPKYVLFKSIKNKLYKSPRIKSK